jgi:ribosomal protein L34
LKARKAPVVKTTLVVRNGRKVVTSRKAPARKTVVEKAVEQVVDIDLVEPVVQTQSGRNVMKRLPFKAGKNQLYILLS